MFSPLFAACFLSADTLKLSCVSSGVDASREWAPLKRPALHDVTKGRVFKIVTFLVKRIKLISLIDISDVSGV